MTVPGALPVGLSPEMLPVILTITLATGAMNMASVARAFDFVSLPLPVLAAILLVTAPYLAVSEYTKQVFFRRFG
jgi:hypothetical protein